MPPSRRPDRSSGGVAQPLVEKWRQLGRGSSGLAQRGLEAVATKWSTWHHSKLAGEGAVAGGPATVLDVLACYRLVLQRPPDPGGLDHYRRRVREGLSVGDLAEEFLGSLEFTRAHRRDRGPDRASTEIVVTEEGFRIHVDPADFAVGHTVAVDRRYEPEVSAAVRQVLERGQTFVDIGANIGWFSLLAASLVGPTGRVVAVEPNPWNVALLRRSAHDNGFDNIEVLTVALAEKTGAVALETDGSNGRVIPIDGPPPQPVKADFVVAAHPLDLVLHEAGVERVDAMKMDVEGAEPAVLRGAAQTIARHRPVLISEFYPLALASWGSAESYLSALRQLGYRLSVIGTDGDQDDASIISLTDRPGTDHVDLLAVPA